jgi:glyoxylase-like metal-dependent hydrolase (beta-lactamase superfamily II)
MIQIDYLSFSRRAFLIGSAATGLLACTTPLPVLAKAPMLNKQAPPFYRFKIGNFEATVISDGPMDLGAMKANLFAGLSPDEFDKTLSDNFLPTDKLHFDQNALVVNTGDVLILFDTGMGNAKMFGDKTGRLLATLKSAGIDPKTIDAVVLTHAHPDHASALMTDKGARNFPKAQIYIAQAEFDFWTDESKGVNDLMKSLIANTRKQLLPNRDRLVFIKDQEEILPGIQVIATPGHTVGHSSYMITSQGKTFCNIGDVVHQYLVATEKPRVEFAFDTDGKQAVETRLRMFDMLATRKIPMVAYHAPWPGVGHLAKQGDAYRYIASPMQVVL